MLKASRFALSGQTHIIGDRGWLPIGAAAIGLVFVGWEN
jgi:hypothetical protein